MVHGSLFSGIGGFDLAAEWAGWENAFHCEWNAFGKKVLNYHWPNAISYDDITKTDFTVWRGRIDVLSGGFPCQPYSVAGKRKGKEDERHLWPEMLRAIREIRPRYVVGENVRGLVSWDAGLVFNEVQSDLENEGYDVFPVVLPAASVNAPHRRERVWFVAYSECIRGEGSFGVQPEKSIREESVNISKCRTTSNAESFQNIRRRQGGFQSIITRTNAKGFTPSAKRTGLQKSEQGEQYEQLFHAERNNTQDYVADTSSQGLQSSKDCGSIGGVRAESNEQPSRFFRTDWQDFPTQPPVYTGDDGLSSRLSGITFPKWRNESLKACGNAIVPQVAHRIFETINNFELLI